MQKNSWLTPTPLVQLPHFGSIFAKLELKNPTGSSKDRAALYMLCDALRRGALAPGGTVIEPTSGNTGIALAALAAQMGLKAILVMPDSMSPERQQRMADCGAQIVLTPGMLGMAGSVEKAKSLALEIPGSFIPDQFSNPANVLAHCETTGPEIWQQCAGQMDYFVCAVGTGGTLTGAGRYLKERNSALKIVAVEPAASPVLSGGKPGPHGLQGMGAGFIPDILDLSLIHRTVTVTEDAAFHTARRLAALEGIRAGISSGAALFAAQKIALENPGKTVVTLLPDAADRYGSCGL